MNSTPELSAEERAKVAEFDAAPEPPEIAAVAPLLAKLRAVEDLADRLRDESRYLDPFTARIGVAERIREALDAS